ncbi:transmembrane protein 266 [Lates japonicus]|uniref:Transmembrane protein 266 n=1 Tax=Lates japonicus TaxID=270547 RepID=A0AAD3NG95_LATJO|nr:transmembrane protein 266 [Lates japonicus]
MFARVCHRAPPQAGASELEVISQQVEEDNQCVAPVQLVSFAYRDLPLAALDISLAGSQLISNPDEEDNREGPARPGSVLFSYHHIAVLEAQYSQDRTHPS